MRTALLTLTAAVVIVLAGGAVTTSVARATATQAAADMHEQMTTGDDTHSAGMAAMPDAGMDTMHAQMLEAMREHMPAEDVQRCQDMHEQMGAHHTGGTGGGDDHAAHHPDTAPSGD